MKLLELFSGTKSVGKVAVLAQCAPITSWNPKGKQRRMFSVITWSYLKEKRQNLLQKLQGLHKYLKRKA